MSTLKKTPCTHGAAGSAECINLAQFPRLATTIILAVCTASQTCQIAHAAHTPVIPKSRTVDKAKPNGVARPQTLPGQTNRVRVINGQTYQEQQDTSKKVVDAFIEVIKAEEKTNSTHAEMVFKRALSLIPALPANAGLQEQLMQAFPTFAQRSTTVDNYPPEAVYVAVLNVHNYSMRFGNAQHLSDATVIEQMLKTSIASAEKTTGKETETTADLIMELISLYTKQARYTEAGPYATRLSNIYQKLPSESQRRMASSLLELAAQLEESQHPIEASMLFMPVTRVASSVKWSNVDDITQKITRIANSCNNHHEYENAEALFKANVALREHSLPEEPMKLAADRRSLAEALEAQRKYGAAEELYRMALADEEKFRGANSTDNLPTLISLTKFYLKRDKQEEAKQLLPRIIEMLGRVPDPDNRHNTTNGVLDLATAFATSGDSDSSTVLLQKCFSLRTNTNYDYQFKQTAEKLIRAYQAAGRPEAAEKTIDFYIKINEQSNNNDTYSLVNLFVDLCRAFIQADQMDKAVKLQDKMLAAIADSPQQRQYHYKLKELAEAYATKGHFAEAEQLLSKSLSAAPPKAKDELAQWLNGQMELAALYGRDKKQTEAEEIYSKVIKTLFEGKTEEAALYQKDVEDLIKIYVQNKQYQLCTSLINQMVNSFVQRYGYDYMPSLADMWVQYEPDRAERIYKQLLNATKQKYNGEENRHYLNILSNYTSFLYRMGKQEEAQEIEKRRRELTEKVNKQSSQ